MNICSRVFFASIYWYLASKESWSIKHYKSIDRNGKPEDLPYSRWYCWTGRSGVCNLSWPWLLWRVSSLYCRCQSDDVLFWPFHWVKSKYIVDRRVIKTRPCWPTISFPLLNRRQQSHMLCWFNKVNVYWCWLVCKITKYRLEPTTLYRQQRWSLSYLAWNADNYLKHICFHVPFPSEQDASRLKNSFWLDSKNTTITIFIHVFLREWLV